MALLPLLFSRPLLAQGGAVSSTSIVQGLGFGFLIPGVSETVQTGDAFRRAEIRLAGSGQVSVRFNLPTVLVSSTGATIPLVFGSRDAAYSGKSATLSPFDPVAGAKINLTAQQGTVRVFLGGTAQPSAKQVSGRYSGTVTIVIGSPNQ